MLETRWGIDGNSPPGSSCSSRASPRTCWSLCRLAFIRPLYALEFCRGSFELETDRLMVIDAKGNGYVWWPVLGRRLVVPRTRKAELTYYRVVPISVILTVPANISPYNTLYCQCSSKLNLLFSLLENPCWSIRGDPDGGIKSYHHHWLLYLQPSRGPGAFKPSYGLMGYEIDYSSTFVISSF